MGILDFFKRNNKSKTEKVETEKPSPEQTLFADTIIEIISPTVEKFGFTRHKITVKTYSTNIVWRKDNKYIKAESTNYPTDYPFYYNLVLGEGDSEDFFEYDWNSIALWRLKKKNAPTAKAQEYEFPLDDKVKFSILNANEELLTYADTFLNGDLTLFYETRSEQNKGREPYKIHTADKSGKYTTNDEPKSVKQKKKYS
jgi:hypothetical protein